MNHVSSLEEPFLSAATLSQATRSHTQGNWKISARKLPISKSGPIEAMSERLGIPVPEMIFGDNMVSLAHVPSGWRIEFTAEAALDQVDKTGKDMLQVAHSAEWSSSREKTSAGIKEVVRPYDWSYSTAYKGTVVQPSAKETSQTERTTDTSSRTMILSPAKSPDDGIPLELLRRRDPILFSDEVILYESELDDNGISLVSVKVRVMPKRMLLLCRLFMRLDGVVCRIRDTRVYVDFDRDVVLRDYVSKEQATDEVATVCLNRPKI
jgi:type 2A phosphatase activator TIP41